MKKSLIVLLSLIPCVLFSQNISKYIVTDQFGYLPESEKIAIIRCPEIGFDANENFEPGEKYSVINAQTGKRVCKGSIVAWKNGMVDSSSGDKTWRFDFSDLKTEGSYYILDDKNNVRSYEFVINANVYKDVLKQALRTFYYQRAGFKKEAKYAGEGWADEASHIGYLQDANCREWGKKDDSTTEKDVHGGWFDAGDFNRYTNWTSDYIMYLLLSYEENPVAWTDDFGIPESGNSIPDILDEVRFGLEHLLRLQFESGAVISVVCSGYGTPPSANKEQSFWGGPSTSATLSAAAAYAYGAKIFANIDNAFGKILQESAIKAWDWAEKNPDVFFYNNSKEHGTEGLAAGQQEISDPIKRIELKLLASLRLYTATNDIKYKTYFEENYKQTRLMAWGLVFPFGECNQDMMLYYTTLSDANPEIVKEIKATYELGIDTIFNLFSMRDDDDPYLACQKDYVWGSNGTKAKQGSIYYNLVQYNVMPEIKTNAEHYAERYIHYLHGVNPLSKCYVTNMKAFGAENSVRQIYHGWFCNNSPKWDDAEKSKFGPVPGFVPGGPNLEYDWDVCCPNNCGNEYNNSRCYEIDIKPVLNQPAQKSYLDMNNGWPINAWSVGEVSGGYQVQYIRLLSKFVK